MNNLLKFIEENKCKLLTSEIKPTNIKGGYVSDLLSDVMGNAQKDDVWITIMNHLNVVAVASLAEIGAIIFPNGIIPNEIVIKKAIEKEVCLISTELSTFEISGKLYNFLEK